MRLLLGKVNVWLQCNRTPFKGLLVSNDMAVTVGNNLCPDEAYIPDNKQDKEVKNIDCGKVVSATEGKNEAGRKGILSGAGGWLQFCKG